MCVLCNAVISVIEAQIENKLVWPDKITEITVVSSEISGRKFSEINSNLSRNF